MCYSSGKVVFCILLSFRQLRISQVSLSIATESLLTTFLNPMSHLLLFIVVLSIQFHQYIKKSFWPPVHIWHLFLHSYSLMLLPYSIHSILNFPVTIYLTLFPNWAFPLLFLYSSFHPWPPREFHSSQPSINPFSVPTRGSKMSREASRAMSLGRYSSMWMERQNSL